MAESDRHHDGQAAEPAETPPAPGGDTRRTSVSSNAQSNHGREQAVPVSMEASQSSVLSDSQQTQHRRQQQPRPARLDYGSIRQDSSRQQTLSPQTPRRPGPARRFPSSAAPHRGQEFSVDDDPDEVDSDLKLARQHTAQESHRDKALRRQQSSVRRRPTAQTPALATVESDESTEQVRTTGNDAAAPKQSNRSEHGDPSSEETLQDCGMEEEQETPSPNGDDDGDDDDDEDEENDDGDTDNSDAESFTLKDRQEAINETHPFGIRIWKPALYKKHRSVQRNAEGDIHSAPGGNVSRWLWVFNCLWTIIFGWWLCIIAAAGGFLCMLLSVAQISGCYEYGRVLINLAHYLFYPFGKYIKLERDEAYLDEDEGEGRSISEYERWQTGDLEEGRLFFGPADISRSLIGRRRDEVEDLNETDSLLGRQQRQSTSAAQQHARLKSKKRLFGRGKWDLGRVIFFLSFYFLITPFLFIVSGICWFLVFSVPMAKVTLLLFYHLRRHPLAMSFHTDSHYARVQSIERGTSGSSILLCTYRAVGLKYWKYTIDGTNIFLINLLGLVVFVIFDYFVLYEALGVRIWITSLGLVFVLALASIIPLAYFIGQAVASISAQSSMGVGATINAFFSTVVEVFLYCVALKDGKAALVEGSIIGSIFAGILFLPGLSMCFGALKRKTQRFNVRSAGVTSTMLLFAVIGAFGPTLFYQIYGGHELNCYQCSDYKQLGGSVANRDCRRCYFDQTLALFDQFYIEAVRPYTWFATICLFLSYVVGLLFTLRTHAAVIWNNEPDEKRDAKIEQLAHRAGSDGRHGSLSGVAGAIEDPRVFYQRHGSIGMSRDSIKDSQMYKRILTQSLKQVGINANTPGSNAAEVVTAKKVDESDNKQTTKADGTPFIVPPKTPEADKTSRIQGLSAEDNRALLQEIAEMAATAATVAARDATRAPRRASIMPTTASNIGKDAKQPPLVPRTESSGTREGSQNRKTITNDAGSIGAVDAAPDVAASGNAQGHEAPSGGHDAPNWSRTKSAVILLTATVAYAVIAEILVDTVDAVLSNIDIDEKFLGITLFALVPNTTEFLNAISFAMNGNVALSMEIGSSYALQVMLLQIPCLVLFSGVYGRFVDPDQVISHVFTLIFPQWDMVTVILAVFLMGWVVGEGKSNYFKGSILIFTYLVVVVGFWFSGYNNVQMMGVDPTDTLALGTSPQVQTFRTIGRGSNGRAF